MNRFGHQQDLDCSDSSGLRQTLVRQHHELRILFDISSALHSSPRLEDVLQQAIQTFLQTLQLKMGALYMFREGGAPGELLLAAHHGFSSALVNSIQRLTLNDTQLDRIRNREPVIWFPADKIVFPDLRRRMAQESIHEIICIALIKKEVLLGLLYVSNHGALQIGRERRDFLTTIGQQVGVAIENARLFDSVQRAKTELEISFDAIQHSIFIIDRRQRVVLVNKTSEKVYGNSGKLIGESYFSVLYEQSSAPDQCPVLECLEQAKPVRREGAHPRWGGFFAFYAFPVVNLDGELDRVVYYEKDVTEEKKLEERLRQSQRLKALGTLAAGIAHEIRNPLATINFNTQLLLRDLDLSEAQGQMFNDMIHEVKKIDQIVRQVLNFARPKEPQFLPHDLNEIVRYCYSLAKVHTRKSNVTFVLELAEGLPNFVVDHNQISQVIMNLIINGIEAMPEGGRLIAGTRWTSDRSAVVLSVTDTGEGILPGDEDRIFDPFFTRKPEGTGLGLSISRQILERHGAYLEVESMPKKGSRFKVVFPVSHIPAT
jgi:two-component system NtrC family sensor kinase